MRALKSILIFFLFSLNTFGQSDSLLKKIFYDLDVNLPRYTICQKIKNDNRFVHIITPSDSGYAYILDSNLYYGKVLDNGIIISKTDSIRIEVSIGFMRPTSINFHKMNNDSILYYDYDFLTLEYFFSNIDTLEKDFNCIIDLLNLDTKTSNASSEMKSNDCNSCLGKVYYYNFDGKESELSVYKKIRKDERLLLLIRYERRKN